MERAMLRPRIKQYHVTNVTLFASDRRATPAGVPFGMLSWRPAYLAQGSRTCRVSEGGVSPLLPSVATPSGNSVPPSGNLESVVEINVTSECTRLCTCVSNINRRLYYVWSGAGASGRLLNASCGCSTPTLIFVLLMSSSHSGPLLDTPLLLS